MSVVDEIFEKILNKLSEIRIEIKCEGDTTIVCIRRNY